MTISPAGIDRIKRYEGFSLHVYDDQAGLPTIGWGHLIKAGEPFDSTTKLTMAEAESLLRNDLQVFTLGVDALLEVEVTQEQYYSIVSLAYNIGLGALRTSSFLRSVNGRESNEAIRERLSRWNKITDPKTKQKVESAGLTKRRADEGAAWP